MLSRSECVPSALRLLEGASRSECVPSASRLLESAPATTHALTEGEKKAEEQAEVEARAELPLLNFGSHELLEVHRVSPAPKEMEAPTEPTAPSPSPRSNDKTPEPPPRSSKPSRDGRRTVSPLVQEPSEQKGGFGSWLSQTIKTVGDLGSEITNMAQRVPSFGRAPLRTGREESAPSPPERKSRLGFSFPFKPDATETAQSAAVGNQAESAAEESMLVAKTAEAEDENDDAASRDSFSTAGDDEFEAPPLQIGSSLRNIMTKRLSFSKDEGQEQLPPRPLSFGRASVLSDNPTIYPDDSVSMVQSESAPSQNVVASRR